jgi:hypothetical protein
MKTPTIHLNGTGRQELLDQWRDAYNALHDARKALHNASPNARDYYPQGSDAIYRAQDEHSKRIETITSLMNECNHIAEAIQDA